MFLNNILTWFVSRYIVYFKIIQWINFEYELPCYLFFLKPIFKYFSKFCNEAPYIQSDINEDVLDKLSVKFLINRTPVNSGTVSLVFYGHSAIEGEVAIKILRNGIKDKITNCLNFVEYIVFFLKYLPYIGVFEPEKFYEEIKEKFLNQIDFKNESDNIEKISKILKNSKNSVILRTLPQYCTENVIVMNYIRGKTVYELDSIERKKCMDLYIKHLTYSLFIKRVMHLDAHPGNILFIETKICLLDLGMVLFLTEQESDFIKDFYNAIENKKVHDILGCIKKHKDVISPDNLDEFIEYLEKCYDDGIIFKEFKLKPIVNDICFIFKTIRKMKYQLNGNIRQLLLGIMSNISLFLYFRTPNNP